MKAPTFRQKHSL